ncbi:unnamed protein product, partial [Coregonus sp. 'balchen']
MLQGDNTVQKLKEEMKQFREESRTSIAKLESRMDKLSQTNDDLRDHLSTTEELEQRERYIDPLNQQLVIMSSASREHVHQLAQISQLASQSAPAQVSLPASQSAPVQVNLPASQSAPAQVSLPASQSAPVQVNLPASQSAPAQVSLPASQSAPVQVNLPASQSAPAQVNLPASQSAPAQVSLPASQSAPTRQPPTTTIVIDSNGKSLKDDSLDT